MRIALLFSALLMSCFALPSCHTCTKVQCINFYSLRLHGFSSSEVEGISEIVAGDTFAISISAREDSSYYYVDNFEIADNTPPIIYYFPGAGKTYTLSDFSFEEQPCNKCLIGRDYSTQFTGCKVNGVEQRSNIIKLER